jgi:hypothetical protein
MPPTASAQPGAGAAYQNYPPNNPMMAAAPPGPTTTPATAAPQPQVSQPGPAQPVVRQAAPNSTQNTLQIAEIRDGVAIMNDGSFRTVIMLKSINFDLMSQQEREAVEFSYQNFLNSLYFPVQIFIRSTRIDLRPYVERIRKIRHEQDNMLLGMLMDDYVQFIAELSQQANIMDKTFYVVIPYFPTVNAKAALQQSRNFFSGLGQMFNSKEQHVTINEADLEAAKNELRNRVQAVLGGLMQCGVQGLPLDTQELIELYYDVYNPDTATRQQIKNFNNLTADVITKGNPNQQPQATGYYGAPQ